MTCYVLLGALALLLASMCGNAMLQTDAKNMMKIPNLGSKTTAKQIVDACGEGKYLKGKTAIVTGGNSGIGLETCKALASAGAKVILCSRDIKVGYEAIQGEIQEKGHGGYVVRDTSNIFVKQLDLSSLASVKSFSEDILATEERIDFLVLNAGIMALPTRETTEVGFEKQLGVNHFGCVSVSMYVGTCHVPDVTSITARLKALRALMKSARCMSHWACEQHHRFFLLLHKHRLSFV